MALDDYAALIQGGLNLAPDLNRQLGLMAQTDLMRAQVQEVQAQAAQRQQQQQRLAAFQRAIATGDGSTNSIAAIMREFPEYAAQTKASHDLQTQDKQQNDLTETSGIFSAAKSGDWALAKKLAHARADAEKANGYSDPQYDAALAVMDSAADGDPQAQKTVLNLLGTHIAAVTGLEHFGSVYGALNPSDAYTLNPGDVRMQDGKMVAHSPIIVDANGAVHAWNGDAVPQGVAGAPGAAPGNIAPAAAAVASSLSNAGLPAPVVAGFMGNFHAEGGWDGAQGDGGSASGIAQWRNERAANFQRVIGKPVAEATPEEQAQFVKWEMDHPEAAGMTVKQRDAILAAKTPAQAAALIDQYYERSNGRDRAVRMSAATAFAGQSGASPSGDQFPVLIPGKSKDAPSGFRWKADGTLEAIPGGPADKAGDVGDPLKKYGISPNMVGQDVLSRLPANLRNQVQALAEGRLPMPSSFALAKPYWQQMLQLTSQYDPSFDASTYQARKSAITAFTGNGRAAQTIGSVNRVANHLETLWDANKKLAGPETGWSVTNGILARAGQAFDPEDAKAYDTAVPFIAGELEKIARNSPGTEAGVDRIVKNLGRANSSKTREAAIKTAVEIISGAIDPLKDQYNSAFTSGSVRPNIPWVSPKAQRIYREIGGVDMSLTGANAGSNNSADGARTVVRTGTDRKTGRKVVQYSDGTISYAN